MMMRTVAASVSINHGRGMIQNRLEPLFALRAGEFGSVALDAQRDVSGYRLCDVDFVRRAVMELREVQHKLAEHTGVESERNECQGLNSFRLENVLVSDEACILQNVRDYDWLCIQSALLPRGAACDSL